MDVPYSDESSTSSLVRDESDLDRSDEICDVLNRRDSSLLGGEGLGEESRDVVHSRRSFVDSSVAGGYPRNGFGEGGRYGEEVFEGCAGEAPATEGV